MEKKRSVDMTTGNVYAIIIKFVIPVILTGLLQSLYNAADLIVVGKFTGKEALAAVGATTSATNLLINVFVGLSSAGGALVAQKFGAKNESGVSKAVHTSVALSLIGGVLVTVVGILLAYPLMRAMSTPENVIELSVLYMRIIFGGVTATMAYNFGASILRAVGDTKRPLYILVFSGMVNVVLNLVLVIVFHLGVAGVAIATITSQIISATLVLTCLVKTTECYRLEIRKIKVYATELWQILHLGIPAGIQSVIFSVSNIMIQSSINSVGDVAMAASAAGASIEGFVYIAMNSFHHAALTFTGQNYGARKFDRIKRGLISACVCVAALGLITGPVAALFGDELLGIYSKSPEVIAAGEMKLNRICSAYFLCGIMDTATGVLRGMGVSVLPVAVTIVGVCGVRLAAVFLGRPYETVADLNILFVSYGVSWLITSVAHIITFTHIYRKKKAKIDK